MGEISAASKLLTACTAACQPPRSLLAGSIRESIDFARNGRLIAAALLTAPASAHHSQSMFDTTKEIVIEGTVARFDW